MQDLIPIEHPNLPVLFAPHGLDALLAEIERQARALVPDLATAKGRRAIASTHARIARSKTYLDNLGKGYVVDLRAKVGAVDAVRRDMRARLVSLQTEVRAPLTAWEEAEAARCAALEEGLRRIRDAAADLAGLSSLDLASRLGGLQDLAIDDSWAERTADAAKAKDAALAILRKALETATRREAEELERQRLAEERAAGERAEARRRQEESRRAAEAQAEAEIRRRVEEQTRLERERLADREARLERTATAAAGRLAVEPLAEVVAPVTDQAPARTAEQVDFARSLAPVVTSSRVQAETLADLYDLGFSVADARRLIEAVANGRIRHLTLNQ
jgi:hypothetical protein